MNNAEVARALTNIAVMLEMEGGNPFRVRAYREAGRVIQAQAESVESLAAEEGRLESLAGIGKDLAAKIRDLVSTGTTKVYEELKAKIPVEVVSLTEIQGLGPKRAGTLYQVLGVKNVQQLEQAAREGKLKSLPGFGEKMEQNLLKALAAQSQWSGRMLIASVWPVAHAIAERLREVKGVTQVEIAGSFRRGKETVGDIDILACGGEPMEVMQAFTTHTSVGEVLGRGDTKSSVKLASGLQVDLRRVPKESFGAALLYFTGSKEHNIELRKIAIENGMSLNEYGLTRGDTLVAGRTEEEVYQALGSAWIPPELREARGEIALARFGKLPRLIEQKDLKADLHIHTDRTDGRETLETMVRAARDRGYEYVAITDHSKALAMSRGFDAARVRQSVGEIEAVRRRVPGIQVLHGLEVDILADGQLDLEDDALELLDWVLVSVHSRFEQDPDTATARVLKALDHPAVHAMGHPTGRMIGVRKGLPFDLERVFEHAAKRGVAMEINAQPDRTDLGDANARLAHEKGVRFVIDTDAHNLAQLEFMRFGVLAARRAGLTREDVLNALPYHAFEEAVRRQRRAAGPTTKPGTGSKAKAGETQKAAGEKSKTKAADAAKAPRRAR